ncbi:wd repeat domain [Anaeramoeba flamelloides]|uniref:Wd repeat domain n=1 Tax=Anaeramoeba flamelloides TaxID=1746091 RepID=A0AAV7YUN8_9EUKA|nr:wd repeat domain [Anaeramoeba flamelloides]
MSQANEFTGYSVLDKLRTEFGEHEGSLFYGLGHDDPRSPFLFQSIVLNVDQQEDYNIPFNSIISINNNKEQKEMGNKNEKTEKEKEKEKENEKENKKQNEKDIEKENENENENENQITTRLGIKRLWNSKNKKTYFNCRTSRNNTSSKGLTNEMIAKRRATIKRIVGGFLQENILRREKGQCECIFDGKKFDSYKECVRHIKTNYKDQIINTLRSMSTFDFEEEPLGDFLTKISYINYIRPTVIERPYTLPAISGSSTVAPYLILHSEEEEKILSEQAKSNSKYMYQNSPKPSLTEKEIFEIEKTLFGRVLTINEDETDQKKKTKTKNKGSNQKSKKLKHNTDSVSSINNLNNKKEKKQKKKFRKGKKNKNINSNSKNSQETAGNEKENVKNLKMKKNTNDSNKLDESKLKSNEKENEQNPQKRKNTRKNTRRGAGSGSKPNQKKKANTINIKGMGLSKEVIKKSKNEIAVKLSDEVISSVVNSFCIKIVSKTVAQERKIYKKVLRKKEAIEKKKREKKKKIIQDLKNQLQNETTVLLFEELKNEFLEKELNDLIPELIEEMKTKQKQNEEKIKIIQQKQKQKEIEENEKRERERERERQLKKEQDKFKKQQTIHNLHDNRKDLAFNNNKNINANNNDLHSNIYPNVNKQPNQFLNTNQFSENKNFDSTNHLNEKQPNQSLKIPLHNMNSYPKYIDKRWNTQNGYYMNNLTNRFPQMENMRPFENLFGMVNQPFHTMMNPNSRMGLYPSQKNQERGLQNNQQNPRYDQKYYSNFDENNNRFIRNDFGYYEKDDFHKLGFETEYQPYLSNNNTLRENNFRNEYYRQERIIKEQQKQKQLKINLKSEIEELVMLKSTPEEFGLNSDLCVVVSGITYHIKQKKLLVSFFKNCKVAIDKNINTKIEFLYRTESRYCFVEFESKRDVENALLYDGSEISNVLVRVFNPPKRKLKNVFTNKSGQKFVLNSKTKNAYFDVLMRNDSSENDSLNNNESDEKTFDKKEKVDPILRNSSLNLLKKGELNKISSTNINIKQFFNHSNLKNNDGWPSKFSIQKK